MTQRFVELVAHPDPPLDELALLVAAHARPGLDVATHRSRLDDLAERFTASGGGDATALRRWLAGPEGFGPNLDDYYDPDNSMLDQVLERRVGIPITLAVVMIEVGRRCGIDLVGVSMPGEFLVRERHRPPGRPRFHNLFRGTAMGTEEARALFVALHGPGPRFDPALLVDVGPVEVVARMLANLVAIAARRRDHHLAGWALQLRTALPGSPPAEQRSLAGVLEGQGRFWAAAEVLERLAERDPAGAARHRADAARLRSGLN